MIANIRMLAVLAVGAWWLGSGDARVVAQDRRYAEDAAQDRRYDEGLSGLNEIGPVERGGAVQGNAGANAQRQPQRGSAAADSARQPAPAVRRSVYEQDGNDDRGANQVPGRPANGSGVAQGAAAQGPAGQRPAGQGSTIQGNGQQVRPMQPVAPFQLNEQQQRFVDELLGAWEKHSGGIKTFECEFSRWEYQPNFGPKNAQGQLQATAISSGVLKYIKPDKGVFHVTETRIFNKANGKYDKAGDDVGEHWVCDGKSVWEVDAKLKQLRENAIPPDMQGVQIANGPLPFMLFGGEATKLKARYFLREQTNPQFAKEEIWLESYPRWAADAANYSMAHLIMKRSDFLPYALRMYSPNGSDYTVFEFRKIKLNNVFMGDIKQPKVSSDYQIIRAQPPVQAAQQPGPAEVKKQ